MRSNKNKSTKFSDRKSSNQTDDKRTVGIRSSSTRPVDSRSEGKETRSVRNSSPRKFGKPKDRSDNKFYRQRAKSKTNKNKHVNTEPGEQMPLNKYLAHAGICSRRDAVSIIKANKVKVNNEIITEPGFKVNPGDRVELNNERIFLQEKQVYILLNKAKGYITTTDDPKGRKTVMDVFRNQIKERIFPVGRLDRETTGLLILTNDGQLTQKLSHPKYEIRKVYQVKLDKPISTLDVQKIKDGLALEDGPIKVDAIEVLDRPDTVGVEIHSGRNRIVRRIFESLGYEVVHLDRVMYADLTKKNLSRGKWRMLTKQEVINLKYIK